MASGDVKDLLITMSLDASNFKKSIADAKSEIKTLKSEFRAAASGDDVENVGKALLQNLQEQKAAAEGMVRDYQQQMAVIQQQLESVKPGSQQESRLQRQVNTLRDGLAKAETSVNNLQTQINNFKLDTFVEKAQTVATTLMELKIGLGDILGGAGQVADSADSAFVSRESAWVGVTKILNDRAGYTEAWGDALNEWNRQVITRIPIVYEDLAQVEAAALQAAGVSMEGLREFTETFVKLQSATNIQGEAGVLNFGKYLTVMGTAEEEYHRIGSVVVSMGNNFASMEDQIVATAKRSASALRAAGFTAQDGLAMATAATAMGMEEAAAATSLEKIISKSAKAAEMANGTYQDLLAKVKSKGYQDVYDFKIAADQDVKELRAMMGEMNLTKSDLERTLNNAIALEKFSSVMNLTPEQYGAAWTEDAARTTVDFYNTLGRLNEEQSQGILTALDYLGIYEVRAARLARNFAMNSDAVGQALDIARTAYAEDKALDEEAERRFATHESRRLMNENKQQNALEAMGDTVTAMRKPFEDFFAEVQQNFAQMPEWAQAGAAGIMEVFGAAGKGLDTAGTLAFDILNIGKAMKELNKTGLGVKLLSGAKGAGIAAAGIGGAALAGYGLVELAKYLNAVSDQSAKVSESLKGIEISIDPASKDATLAAIAQVQAAADQLKGGGEQDETAANTSRVVQMGYGTATMAGTALGYEKQRAENQIAAIYADFGGQIRAQEEALLSGATDADKQAAQQRIVALTASMEAAVADAQREYTGVLQRVMAGAIRQAGQSEELERVARNYDLLNAVYQGWADYSQRGDTAFTASGAKAALQQRLQEAGASLFDGRGNLDFTQAASQMYALLAEDVQAVMGNGQLMSLFAAALESGAFDNADTSALEGAVLGLFQSLDVQHIGEAGAQNWQEIGRFSMMGLAEGVTNAQGEPIGAAEGTAAAMIEAAKAILGVHSPSTVFEAIGGELDAGLAAGITGSIPDAVAAMAALGAAVAAEARKQADLIRNAMTVIAPAPRYAVGGGAASGGGATTTNNSSIVNNYNFAGASPAQTQNVKALAREITSLQKRSNAAVGALA